jgi:hypothetical protein
MKTEPCTICGATDNRWPETRGKSLYLLGLTVTYDKYICFACREVLIQSGSDIRELCLKEKEWRRRHDEQEERS